ncbi:unnamed protein product, partial [Onchocerca flexuosa]|uniref:Tudor domain-containing protein n=1 Tax=Onchocerca flexuosa TaxID=387005 RepID=A0A183HD75_9BILA
FFIFQEILYTPRQGIRCRIDGIRPLNHEEKWPEEVQKCIDNLLAPSASFEAIFGSPNKDGVYPIKVMVLRNQLIEKDSFGMDEANNANNKIELVSWLVAKGYAETQDIWRKYPVKNLLFDGKHEYTMIITEVDGQIIRARPYVFAEQYNKMKKALANIELIPLGTDATTGLITLNKENKRAMLISTANNASSKKCLLVDEGICIEEIPVQFYGSKELYDSDSFLVRTCHRLSVQCRFTKFLLDEESRQMILSSAASGPAKVILTEYIEDSYLISDIFFSDRTTLIEKVKKAKQGKIDEKESVLGFVANDLQQASGGNLNQSEKAEDLRLPTIGKKEIECSQNLVIDENSYLKPQVSEIKVYISDDTEKEYKTFDPEIITFMDSLVASVSKFDKD